MEPADKQIIRDLDEYKLKISSLTHVAVSRRGYEHHYLVMLVHEDEDEVDLIHYTFCKESRERLAVAVIALHTLSLKHNGKDPHNLLDFKSGVYFIKRNSYPNNLDDDILARLRAVKCVGETEYSLAVNNCESVVTWILTGKAFSEQFENAGSFQRALADGIDGFCDNGTKIREGLIDLPGRFYAFTAISLLTEAGDDLFLTFTKRIVLKEVTKAATKVGPSAITSAISCGVSAAIALPVEAGFCAYEIGKLEQQREINMISRRNFKRQKTKKIAGSATSSVLASGGGLLGTFIGQIACPIPIVGGLIGGAVGGIVGSVVGRSTGSAVSGKIFDEVKKKEKDDEYQEKLVNIFKD